MAEKRKHYQIRLVKRFDGRRIVTHPPLANAKSTGSRDKTLDVFEATSDRSALGRAREYNRRSDKRKGPLPGDYLGAVVVRYETDTSKQGVIRRSRGGSEVTNRRRRLKGTTSWLYFVDPEGDAYHVDARTYSLKGRVL